MLVDVHDIPLKVRCPNLMPWVYDQADVPDEDGYTPNDYFGFAKHWQTGVYSPFCTFNGQIPIEGIQVWYDVSGVTHLDPWGQTDEELCTGAPSVYSCGVADNLEQILQYFKVFIDDPVRTYVISIDEVARNNDFGWRWNRWGDYIGTQSPQKEYLADEPVIESVLTFTIMEVKLPA